MNRFHSVIRTAAATFLLAGAMSSVGVAQPVEIAAPVKASSAKAPETRLIQVRNVRSDMMAWWLDPVRNTVPLEVAISYESLKKSGQSAPQRLMPEMQEDIYVAARGLISFSSISPQNALMAYGSEEGIRRFEEIVKSLDKPVTQIEISAQFVQIRPEDAAKLNIEFSAAPKNGRVGFARGDTQAQVDALVQQGKARVINSPRITTLNNLTAQASSMMSVPAVLGVRGQAGELKPVFDSTQDAMAARLRIGTTMGFIVTPSVQNDGVISLNVGPYKSLHVVVDDAPGALPANPYSGNNPYAPKTLGDHRSTPIHTYQTIFLQDLGEEMGAFKVRDGETLVFTGLNWTSAVDDVVSQGKAAQNPAANVILLVTPRVLRRADATPIALHRIEE